MAFWFTSYSNAQVDPTTGNLINSSTTPTDTTSIWNNGVYVNQLCFYAGDPGNCGPNPSIRNGGIINFSYGTADLNQVININTALASAGTGVQVSGFNFGFTAKNGNGWDGGQQDYLAAYVKLYGAGGNQIANYDYSSDTNKLYNWTNFNFSETFASPYVAATLSTAQVGFVGRDNNFWAGNYGPEVYNVDFRLKYKVDPCATNPAYSPTCAGFNNVLTTNNLLDSTKGGTSLNQAFAINTALQSAGVGAMVHGFNYGFNWRVGQGFSGCTAWNQDGSCSWTMNIPAYANATVSLTNKNNQTIHQQNYSFSGASTSGSVSEKFLLPASMNQSMLGTGRIAGSASGTGSSIEGAWATLIYTADPCTNNPLYSPDCKGYAVAIAKSLAPPTTETTVASAEPTQNISPAPEPTQTQLSNDGASLLPPGSGSTVAATNSTPAPSNTQSRAGEVSAAGSSARSGSGPSMSMIMNILSRESARVGNVEQSAVSAAVAGAEAAGTQATQQAEAVAESQTAASVASSLEQSAMSVTAGSSVSQTTVGTSLSTSQSSNFAATSSLQQTFTAGDVVASVVNQTSDPTVRSATQSTDTSQSFYTSVNVNYALTAPVFSEPVGRNATANTEIELPRSESLQMGTRSTLTDYLSERSMMSLMNTDSVTDSSVRRNVQPNEAAGGVDIASMATQPPGYAAYTQVTLSDAAFYRVDTIYKNQRTVDNARVMRGLQRGSDRLHQDMVEQQYK